MKELLRIRDARLVLAARAASQVGDAMTLTALSILVARTGRPIDLTFLLIAFALPVVVLARHAGRLVDTRDSRTVLAAAGLVQVVGSAGLLVSTSLPWQIGCILLVQSGQAVLGPGWGALLPRIVGEERIAHAIGLQQALGSGAWLAGTALGGIAYAAIGFEGVVLVDTVTFAGLVVAAWAVRTRREPPSATQPGGASTVTPSLESGMRILRRDRVAAVFVGGLVVFVAALEGINAVESFLVIDVLHGGPTAFGLVGLCLGVGVTTGSMLCGRVAGDNRRVAVVAMAAAGMGLSVALAGAAPSVLWLLPLFLVAGVGNGLLNGLGFAVIVGRVRDEVRGRVLATAMGAIRAGSVLSLLAAGVAGGIYGVRAVFVAGGLLAVAVAPLLLLARQRHAVPVDPAALEVAHRTDRPAGPLARCTVREAAGSVGPVGQSAGQPVSRSAGQG